MDKNQVIFGRQYRAEFPGQNFI